MKNNQKGFGLVEVLLILILVVLLGFVGWYVMDSNKKTNDALSNADKSSQTTVVPSSKPDSLFKIKELGIQFKLPSELKGLKYTADTKDSVTFYMPDLDVLADKCEDKGPMVINGWTKVSGSTHEETPGVGLVKLFEGYHIIANGGPSGRMCSDKKVSALKIKYATAFRSVYSSVEEIK